MGKAIDLTGRQFGKLTALERINEKRKSRKALWLCHCECGNQVKVESDKLSSGETKSCGCLRVEKGKAVQEYNVKHLINDEVFTPLLKSKTRVDNSTGIKGVGLVKRKNTYKYKASIKIKGKTYHLGYYDTLEEASRARKLGEEKYHKPYLE